MGEKEDSRSQGSAEGEKRFQPAQGVVGALILDSVAR